MKPTHYNNVNIESFQKTYFVMRRMQQEYPHMGLIATLVTAIDAYLAHERVRTEVQP